MKYIYRLELIACSLLMIFYSCSHPDTSVSKQSLPKSDSLNIDSSNVRNEDFRDFFLLFSKDTAFQLERVVFPFKSDYLDSTDTKVAAPPLYKEQWKHLHLLSEDGCITSVYDSFKHELRNTDERVFAIEEMVHEGATYYYFKRIKGKWYLVKQEAFAY